MAQYFGLILLLAAVAAGVYVATNYADLINLRIEVPVTVRPATIPSTGISGGDSPAVISTSKPARITSIRQPNSFNPYWEAVISSSLNRGESVNITGWTVKSNQGSFTLPQAQEVYSFGGRQGDVILRYGDRVNLYSGRGLQGNFRLNKCLGYLEDASSFSPALPRSCPAISRPEIAGFSGACQSYINSLRSCQNPAANPPVPLEDAVCHDFLRKLNYVGCVEKYGNDSDFLQNEWRIWLEDRINIFDAAHDKVQLLDREGKAVDEYVY